MYENIVLTGAKRGLVKSQSGNCDGLVNVMHITFDRRLWDLELGYCRYKNIMGGMTNTWKCLGL